MLKVSNLMQKAGTLREAALRHEAGWPLSGQTSIGRADQRPRRVGAVEYQTF